MMMSTTTLGALVAWGTVVGVDLVSFPQAMLSRPLVAASVAGLITGDLEAGLRVGMVLELFALDVLPVGASRYPDFGPGAVAAVAFASGRPWAQGLGFAVLLGLGMALVGGRSMILLRLVNGRRVRKAEAALAAGDARVIGRLQLAGFLSDAVRSALLTVLGLVAVMPLAWLAATVSHAERDLTLAMITGGLVAAFAGLVRRAGRGIAQFWIGVGLLAGGVLAWVV